MSAESLHWMVPCRRAVVRDGMSYAGLILAWIEALDSARAALGRWYGVAEAGSWDAGIGSIRGWLARAFAEREGHKVAREAQAAIDTAGVAYYVRLWKGPLRVLLEAEKPPAPLKTEIANPQVIEVEHGGSVPLALNGNGEVTRTDARFLMGDVVEFPLFKFLGACGRTEFGAEPGYEDKLAFNGEGSFLLGTSLRERGGVSPPSSPALHDNFVAMRFQALLNGCLAAFSDLKPVFKGNRGENAPSGERTVYARGFIYAGSLGRPVPRASEIAAHPRKLEHWKFVNNGWCEGGGGMAPNLPSLAGLAKLGDRMAVTPGMVCSSATLFLANYMMRHYAARRYGNDSVFTTIRGKSKAGLNADIIQDYEVMTSEEVGALVPPLPPEELRRRRDFLIQRLNSVLALVDGPDSFLRRVVAEARQRSEWATDVQRATAGAIERSLDNPARLMNAVRKALLGPSPPQSAVMERVHARLVEGAQAFRSELDALLESEEWADFTTVLPDFSRGGIPGHIENIRAIACPGGRCPQRHAFASIGAIRAHLKTKLRNLEKPRSLTGGKQALTLDLSAHLRDITVFSLQSHEFAVVRLYPPEGLLEAAQIPQAGFPAAYHPLSGVPFPSAARGQCHLFESGDFLHRWADKASTFDCGPFRWKTVEGNRFTIQVQGNIVAIGDGDRPRDSKKYLLGLVKLRAGDALAAAHLQPPKAFRPIFIYPNAGGKARLVDNGQRLYAARAVPFPTMAEVAGAFAVNEAVPSQQERARQEAIAALDLLEKDLAAARVEADGGGGDAVQKRVRTLADQVRKLTGYVDSLGGRPRPPAEAAASAAGG